MMEFETWWLLALPMFFGLGWLAARVDIGQLLTESRRVPISYFRGLNFLLNEQPDKAVEAFIEASRVNTETVELHFALGGLFRRRGEVERAIRMHQNVLDRETLSEEQRLMALHELGQDYLKAGLLDRAEQLFSQLLPSSYAREALKFLLEIYVTEKDWLKAIDTARQLASISNEPHSREISHFYCELAVYETVHSNPTAAREHLQQALAVYRKSPRATILLGDLEAVDGKHEAALQIWKELEMQSPQHLPLVGERLLTSHRVLGRMDEAANLLRGFLARHPSLDMLNVVHQAVMETQGAAAAYRLVRDELRRHPTLQGLDKLLEAQQMDVPMERRDDMLLIKNLLHQHAQRLAFYQCETCGFKARQFYWHCPACGNWDSYPPRRNEE